MGLSREGHTYPDSARLGDNSLHVNAVNQRFSHNGRDDGAVVKSVNVVPDYTQRNRDHQLLSLPRE